MAEGTISVASKLEPLTERSKVSTSLPALDKGTSPIADDGPPSPDTQLSSRSMPDVTVIRTQSPPEKKTWETLLSSSMGSIATSEDGCEPNMSMLSGFIDLYNIQAALASTQVHGVPSTIPPLMSPSSPTAPLFSGTVRSTEENNPAYSQLVKKSPPSTMAGVQGSVIASSPPLERSCHTQAGPPTVFDTMDRYHYFLEAPTSMMTSLDEDTLTYLNKGQFYSILFESNTQEVRRVRSVVQLVFREEKDARSELSLWEYWHSQQPNPSQHAFDVDRKACKNIDTFDDVAYNAYSFVWETNSQARVAIRMNCLSTEFSPQKGVKGMPLFLQVETFEDLSSDDDPAHRCYCKLKIFRDKGAERKNKDESRSADRRRARILKAQQGPLLMHSHQSIPSPAGFFRAQSKVTKLSPTSTFGRKSVLFIPSPLTATTRQPVFNNQSHRDVLMSIVKKGEAKRTFSATLTHASDELDDLDMGSAPKMKAARNDSSLSGSSFYVHTPARTIYVRKEEEKVYNAIMLDYLTVAELSELIGRKYNVPADTIKHVYKRTKKGLLVNMEDRMVEMFANEDDIIVQLEFDNQLGYFELVLNY